MAAFPTYVRYGWRDMQEEPESAVERAEMERGIPKQRRISSDVRVALQLTLHFDSATDAANFETWFYNTINAGQDFFDFTLPRTGAVVQARFVGGVIGALQFGNRTLGISRRQVELEYWRSTWP